MKDVANQDKSIQPPSNWRTARLGDLCRIELGKTPARGQKAYWDEERVTGNVWLSIADMPTDLHANARDSREYVSASGAALMKVVPEGTLLLSFKLTLGRLCYAGTDLYTNEAIASLRDLDESRILKPYLYWYLSYFDWDAASAGDHKIKGRTLNKAKLKELEVLLPPLEDQKRIVAVLDQAFGALDRARAHAEANLADAGELFDNSLLALFEKLLPTSEMMTLSEAAADFSRGKSRHRPRNDPKLYGGEYPFIQTGDIRRSVGSIREYTQTYNDVGLAQSKLWPAGTVCITIAANIAETGVLEFDGCFPDSVIGMVPDAKISNAYYIEYMLRFFAKELKLQGKGSAQDNINLATFENARFPVPGLKEQTAVVEKLDSLAAEVAVLKTSYQKLIADIADLRQSLLQKAFNGQLI